jgi:hypothetical protein
MRLASLAAALPLFVLTSTTGCVIGCGGWSRHWVEATEEFDLPAKDVDHLAVTTLNGAIEVHAGAVDTVHVVAHKRAGGDSDEDARQAMGELSVVRTCESSTLTLRSEWIHKSSDAWQASVAFDVTVPARCSARLVSHNGAVTVRGLEGDVTAESSNGALDLETPARQVAASTSNGRIQYRGGAEQLKLETSNGAVHAALSASAVTGSIVTSNGAVVVERSGAPCGTVEGRTSNGHVTVRAPGATSTVERGRFKVEYAQPDAAKLRVETSNGAVEVR